MTSAEHPATPSFQDARVACEALVSTVARAFYDDEAVVLVGVLLREGLLRDDVLSDLLPLPARRLRKTLEFLRGEGLVDCEAVLLRPPSRPRDGGRPDASRANDAAGGEDPRCRRRRVRVWFVDFDRAVDSVRLRLFLARTRLEDEVRRLRSSTALVCPGYETGECNGRYTEEEAQAMVDPGTGSFLCVECADLHRDNPDGPPAEAYTLGLEDKTCKIESMEEKLRRLDEQMSERLTADGQLLRGGIYRQLERVRKMQAAGILPSNSPSDILRREANLPAFHLEVIGSARAHLLATRGRRERSLLDDAATRVSERGMFEGVGSEGHPVKTSLLKEEAEDKKEKEVGLLQPGPWFLQDPIGRIEETKKDKERSKDTSSGSSCQLVDQVAFMIPDEDQLESMTKDERRAAFQKMYRLELARQADLLGTETEGLTLSDGHDEVDSWSDIQDDENWSSEDESCTESSCNDSNEPCARDDGDATPNTLDTKRELSSSSNKSAVHKKSRTKCIKVKAAESQR